MKKRRLYTPGPTPIPPESVLAMAQPIDYHRSADASDVIRECAARLKTVFQTDSDVAILTSTGTGAMECAVVNCFSPGDRVIAVRSGKFGERWADIGDAYGLDILPLDVEWGKSVDPTEVERMLNANPSAKAVLATLCETSTGALHDIQALAELTRTRETLLIVDAVSALGADEIRMDAWGVDALVSCSQKGLMTPPGLAFCALGDRAQKASESSTLPKHYFDYARYRASLAKDTTPYTPAISLYYGLLEALRVICDEGMDAVYARHARLANATRVAVKALGLTLFPDHPANTLTAIRLPESVDGKRLVAGLRDDHGIIFAGGQEHLAGKIARIAHLGWMDDYDAIVAVSALERGLLDAGFELTVGSGVAAAQAILSA